MVIGILDNASIHKSKKVKSFLKKNLNIRLFYLPAYSPEYNPIEMFWKWLKPKIYGFSAIGGLKEIISRFRKWTWHYNREKLPNPIKFNLQLYTDLL